ncbi:MAG TPA: NlpC/P60 family protein [Hanamia sp.]|nr:NlpC/P60 family protein [Hanamia sp.]
MNLNKLALSGLSLLFICFNQTASAQASVNKIDISNNGENASPVFINGISFTPDGILRTTESGGTKSIKSIPAPIVTRQEVSKAVAIESYSSSTLEKLSTLQYKYAMMMDVNVESLKNLSLLEFIDDWFGTRYRMGGTTKRGIDCSALSEALLLAVYGFSIPRTAREQYDATEHIDRDELREGDLVFFNTRGGVSHVGVYLDNDYFFQASSHGVTISSLDDEYYSKRFICGGRVIDASVSISK